MKIAITYQNGEIFQHFGHTQQFQIYTVENHRIIASQIVDTEGKGHGALAEFLSQQQVEVLICGGIGAGAQQALKKAGIRLLGGVSGTTEAAITAYLAGNLAYNPAVRCDHHDHGNHVHICGSCAH